MMIHTSRFGALEYEHEQIISFESGIPGFKDYKKYMIVSVEDSPFRYLQSLEEGSVAFIIVSPFEFHSDYEFQLPEQVKAELNISSDENLEVYNIVSVQEELVKATLNLAAPIIINRINNMGIQLILPDGVYSIHHPLFAERIRAGGE